MRVWRLPPNSLDNRRLNGQHAELHAAVSIHFKMIEIAKEQGVEIYEIDWYGLKLGWRSHPQIQYWIGRVGALIEYHDMVMEEMSRRKWMKSKERDSGVSFTEFMRAYDRHKSLMFDTRRKLEEIDTNDESYGTFFEICDADINSVIRDYEQLFVKWEKDREEGFEPTGMDEKEVHAIFDSVVRRHV